MNDHHQIIEVFTYLLQINGQTEVNSKATIKTIFKNIPWNKEEAKEYCEIMCELCPSISEGIKILMEVEP